MVIEVFVWPGVSKTHARDQQRPMWTLCGRWMPPATMKKVEGVDVFPTCKRCATAVMKS